MDIAFQYTKRRCDFGRQILFCEQGPEMCDSIVVNPAEHKSFILRNPIHQPTQNTPVFSESFVNTFRADYSSSGANHSEGGWPKDVIVTDPEATQRYRRKVEKEDGYIHCVMSTAAGMDHYVHQNNAIDMYETYYTELAMLPTIEQSSVRTVNVYRDPGGCTSRPISSISWQAEGAGRFAATYVNVDFDRISLSPITSFIWDLENVTSPEVTFTPPCPMLDLKFHPRDSNVLVGGLMDGCVSVWDRRKGGTPAATNPPHVAHRDLVRNVIIIHSKSGQEFFSGGLDGACKWWDMRNLSEPTDEMIIDVVKSVFDTQSMGKAYGVSTLEYEPTIPTRFMVGTDNGYVVMANRKGKTPLEQLPGKFGVHHGPVWSLERNPFFLKNFLTVGDWTVRVWSEDCRDSAVLWSPPMRHKVTCGTWSPTKCSLMMVSQTNGMVSLWDLLQRQHEPTLSVQVCEEPLLRMSPHEGGSLVACGSSKGHVYLIELSTGLSVPQKHEKPLFTLILDRESKRERILEARTREIKLKMRQAEEGGSPVASTTDFDLTHGDKDLLEAANEYMAQVKKEISLLT